MRKAENKAKAQHSLGLGFAELGKKSWSLLDIETKKKGLCLISILILRKKNKLGLVSSLRLREIKSCYNVPCRQLCHGSILVFNGPI